MAEELTPMEVSALTQFLGIEAEDLDTFKNTFNSTFIRRDNVKSDEKIAAEVTGKRLGLLEQDVRKAFKNVGFALDNLDTNGKKVEELIELGLTNMLDKHQTKVSELEELGIKDKDEAFKELEGKLERLNKKYIEEKELRERTAMDFSNYKEESANKLKLNTISTLRQQAFQNATFKQSMSDLEKDGFNARINSNYRLDLDDNGGLMVTDSEGARIPNPAVSGTFMTFDDVLRQEAIKNNLYPMNEKAGQKVTNASFKDVVPQEEAKPRRTISRTYRG